MLEVSIAVVFAPKINHAFLPWGVDELVLASAGSQEVFAITVARQPVMLFVYR